MQISIHKFRETEIENKIRWINDPENNRFLHYDLPLMYDKTLAWFQANKDRTDRYDAVICADGVSVGLIGLLGIDQKNAKAELYVALGEADYKGKGVALRASELLLKHAFEVLKLNKVYLYTEKENYAAQKLFERSGFQKEGLLKEDLIYKGRKVDRFVYGITAEEFCAGADKSASAVDKAK